jgi:hypothetical protein
MTVRDRIGNGRRPMGLIRFYYKSTARTKGDFLRGEIAALAPSFTS